MAVHHLSGLDDPGVADYVHVGDPEWLLERGLFVAEGRMVVRRLLGAGTFKLRSILLTPAAHAALQDDLDSTQYPVSVCQQDTMNRLAGFNFHRGCLALGERPPVIAGLDRFVRARCLLALEGVGNPDNVGGLFRVAVAFGADGVLLDRTSGDPLYRKAIRTSMGWSFSMPFAKLDGWLLALGALRDAGAELVALTPDRSSVPLGQYVRYRSSNRPLVLMLGAEGPGLTPDALAVATSTVRIPIAAGVDSLNVVVAAGIALAALARQAVNA